MRGKEPSATVTPPQQKGSKEHMSTTFAYLGRDSRTGHIEGAAYDATQ